MRCVAWLVPFHVQQDGRSSGEKKLGYAGLCKRLTAWRTDAPVHPCNSHSRIGTCLRQPLRQTDRFPTFQEDTLSQQP